MGRYTPSPHQAIHRDGDSLIGKHPMPALFDPIDKGLFGLEAASPPSSACNSQIEKTRDAEIQAQAPCSQISSIRQPLIMPLGARHEAIFRDLLLNLDKPSLSSRFSGTVSDDCLVRHSRCAFSTAAYIAGAFIDDGLRGVVEVYDIADSRAVEAAFVVEQKWRRRGLGSALLKAALQWAAEADRTILRMAFSRRNWPMRKLASNAEARLDLGFDDISADVAIGPVRIGGQVAQQTQHTSPPSIR